MNWSGFGRREPIMVLSVYYKRICLEGFPKYTMTLRQSS
jgi:hypothetical protein